LPADTHLPDAVALLRSDGANLPKVVRLHSVYRIVPEDHFKMRPGYRNFQRVRRGEHLADDRNGPVLAKTDGYVLMPLYQNLGHEGFFLVQGQNGENGIDS
jgi:succinylglutamate desuccinylase